MKVCPVCQYEEEDGNEVACAICGSDLESEVPPVEEPIPEEPTMFSKFNNTITKYNGDVIFDSKLTQEMDWEVEMVIVIISVAFVLSKIFDMFRVKVEV